MMPIVTLLTDFGIDDEYVGIMKGVILSINPSVAIVDITHQIDPQDLIQAAYLLKSIHKFFPEGTVHVAVVDPGVGSGRDALALEIDRRLYVAPDNGVLTLLTDEGDIGALARIENSEFFLTPVSQTFHGRDIFAPVAAYLSKGVSINKLGRPLRGKDLKRLAIPKPFVSIAGELLGSIVSIDRFGNLITDIDSETLQNYYAPNSKRQLEITIGDSVIKGISRSYANVNAKSPLALIGSRGYLEIAVNKGSAKIYFKSKKGDTISVKSMG